jgi:hypothetical protein
MNDAAMPTGPLGRWNAIPLHWRILLVIVMSVVTGLLFPPGPDSVGG